MKSPKDYIIFALDVPTVESARHYVDQLGDSVGMFKVGLELYIRSGPEIIARIKDAGAAQVFLDLKLHDIPATVARAMQRIAELDVALTTVHCAGSKMLSAAVQGSDGKVGILGVTVLTSMSMEDIREAGFKDEFADDLSALAFKRAAMAKAAGCRGVICSGREVEMLKGALGKNFLAVTPGIRPQWEVTPADDQARVVTPARAVACGADYIVIGRPIRDAQDPRDAARRIADEIESVL
jgi:orotidine-5'-phosphate decarboxylase